MARLECACIAKKTSASSACTLYRGQLIASSARKLPIGIKKKVTIPSTTSWCTRRKHLVSEDFEQGRGKLSRPSLFYRATSRIRMVEVIRPARSRSRRYEWNKSTPQTVHKLAVTSCPTLTPFLLNCHITPPTT